MLHLLLFAPVAVGGGGDGFVLDAAVDFVVTELVVVAVVTFL